MRKHDLLLIYQFYADHSKLRKLKHLPIGSQNHLKHQNLNNRIKQNFVQLQLQCDSKFTSEVDAADRIDVIMHVGRVAAALAAVAARPLRLRALHPDAQPVPALLVREA